MIPYSSWPKNVHCMLNVNIDSSVLSWEKRIKDPQQNIKPFSAWCFLKSQEALWVNKFLVLNSMSEESQNHSIVIH